jgi:cytidylate kinase
MDARAQAYQAFEALLRAERYPRTAPPPAPPSPAFTVAVSREAGSGGAAVAREVGWRLGWPVYDNELLTHLAGELRVDVHLLEGVDERPGSRLVEFVEAFAATAAVTEVTYFRRLLKLLLALGARGDCVIVGRGAMIALPVDTTLRVRVVASEEDRVAAVGREHGLGHDEAARHVASRDRERRRFIKDHFHKDLTDPLLYDLVLNASRFSVDECAALVIEALQLLQARKPARESRPTG